MNINNISKHYTTISIYLFTSIAIIDDGDPNSIATSRSRFPSLADPEKGYPLSCLNLCCAL